MTVQREDMGDVFHSRPDVLAYGGQPERTGCEFDVASVHGFLPAVTSSETPTGVLRWKSGVLEQQWVQTEYRSGCSATQTLLWRAVPIADPSEDTSPA